MVQSLHHNLYHNFYHKFDHNCGLGVQGKLSRRTWHYPRCAGEARKSGKVERWQLQENLLQVEKLELQPFKCQWKKLEHNGVRGSEPKKILLGRGGREEEGGGGCENNAPSI